MKAFILFLSVALLCAANFMFSGCAKDVFACFTTDVKPDSIHINQIVTFNGVCSNNANDYNWQLTGIQDSVFFGQIFSTSFKDSGTVTIYLLVTNGRKSSTVTQNILVRP